MWTNRKVKFAIRPAQTVALADAFEQNKLLTRQQLELVEMGDRANVPATPEQVEEILSKVAGANIPLPND